MRKRIIVALLCTAAAAAAVTGCRNPDYQALFAEKVMDDLAAAGGPVATIDTLSVDMRGDTAVVDARVLLRIDDTQDLRCFTQDLRYVFMADGEGDFGLISKTKGRPRPVTAGTVSP